ncbi:hypothetical protein SAMN04488109_5459 [Chryseolinea serpens]|uniref:Uncharacterized protein n=1 Tax=Chryseolinea serpens TaxID=947013 RepID=A0A1M5VVX2_9BACT|nr:hypothetical protein [Chryseolinea serpens]SHH79402.1 hypothetical protein SAMN04488109_5459 [Chryseolinea serpens]
MRQGKFTIVMSASVPSGDDAQYARSQVQIENAVIALARAVFHAGGTLVFGGHPSISPLVAMVATEFENDRDPYTSIIIYQSLAYRDVIPRETQFLFTLGFTEVRWIPAEEGEIFNPYTGINCPRSLLAMRQRMMTEPKPHAMVCIGGKDVVRDGVRIRGVLDEFEIFKKERPGQRIFLFKSTGGTTEKITQSVDETGARMSPSPITVIDKEYAPAPGSSEAAYLLNVPYAFLAGEIVRQVILENV